MIVILSSHSTPFANIIRAVQDANSSEKNAIRSISRLMLITPHSCYMGMPGYEQLHSTLEASK
jgi:hypothetical protein